jgi:hypothetical protein
MALKEDAPADLQRLAAELKKGKQAARRGDAAACWAHFDVAEAILAEVAAGAKPARKLPKEKSEDVNQAAFRVMRAATQDEEEDAEVNAAAAAMGRRGGLKGGAARAASLTPQQRSEIAKKAAAARWRRDED